MCSYLSWRKKYIYQIINHETHGFLQRCMGFNYLVLCRTCSCFAPVSFTCTQVDISSYVEPRWAAGGYIFLTPKAKSLPFNSSMNHEFYYWAQFLGGICVGRFCPPKKKQFLCCFRCCGNKASPFKSAVNCCSPWVITWKMIHLYLCHIYVICTRGLVMKCHVQRDIVCVSVRVHFFS